MVKVFCKYALITSLSLWLPLSLSASIKKSAPLIKVKIGSNLQQLQLSGKNLTKKNLLLDSLQTYKGNSSVYFNCRAQKERFQKRPATLVASLKVNSGLIAWKNSRYKGELLVATSGEYSGCDLINEVSLEDYISSLLAKEMNGSWHLEALKAQAVAARSYAYQKIRSQSISKKQKRKLPYDIINSERYQVSGGYHDATAKTIQAAQETAGEVLVTTKGAKLVPIFYHADCDGKTFLPEEIWGVHYAGYQSVSCLHPGQKKITRWKVEISTMQWLRFINWYKRVNNITRSQRRIRIFPDRKKRSYLRVYLDKRVTLIPKSQIRRFFGHKKIFSSRFLFKRTGRYYTIYGAGRGHGVGMSQMGALYQAKNGRNYRQILKHYYPGFRIKKLY